MKRTDKYEQGITLKVFNTLKKTYTRIVKTKSKGRRRGRPVWNTRKAACLDFKQVRYILVCMADSLKAAALRGEDIDLTPLCILTPFGRSNRYGFIESESYQRCHVLKVIPKRHLRQILRGDPVYYRRGREKKLWIYSGQKKGSRRRENSG